MPRPEVVNGKAAGLPEGWNLWPGINEAARMLQTSHAIVTRLVSQGAIQKIEGPDGKPRYNPDDIASAEGLFDEKAKAGGLTPDDFKAGNELVKLVHAHHSTMVPLLVDGYRSMLEVAKDQLAAIRLELKAKDEQIALLLKQRDETAKERETLITQEHERMLQQRVFESSERRKDRAVSAVTDKLAPLLMQKLGMGDPKMQLGIEFLKTVERDQLMGLLAIGVLNPKQTTIVRKLVEPLTKDELEALDGKPISNDAATVPPPSGGDA